MKLRIKYNIGKWIMWKNNGRVLYPFVLFKPKQKDVSNRLFRHEMEHVYQIRRMGFFKFHIQYLYLLWKGGYEQHPFEVEARDRQYDPLTKTERTLKNHETKQKLR